MCGGINAKVSLITILLKAVFKRGPPFQDYFTVSLLQLSQVHVTADEGSAATAVQWAAAASSNEAISVMVRHGVQLLSINKVRWRSL